MKNATIRSIPSRDDATDGVSHAVVTREYTLLRDRIEAVTALANATRRNVEVLDLEVADSMTIDAKVGVADRAWTSLMREIDKLDT